MHEPYILRLAGHHLYVAAIEDNLNLTFTDNEIMALHFSLNKANKLSNLLESETPHSFVVEELND